MRWILLIAIVIAVPILIATFVARRPAPEHEPETIDAETDPTPPSAEATRHMADPPPGSRGDRERKGMP